MPHVFCAASFIHAAGDVRYIYIRLVLGEVILPIIKEAGADIREALRAEANVEVVRATPGVVTRMARIVSMLEACRSLVVQRCQDVTISRTPARHSRAVQRC